MTRLPLMRGCLGVAAAIALTAAPAAALEWLNLAPNPAYSRDLAMGASTISLSYTPQSQSVNPAGFALRRPRPGLRPALFVNAGGFYQACDYLAHDAWRESAPSREGRAAWDVARMIFSGAALQVNIVTLATLISQPVMPPFDLGSRHYDAGHPPLDRHQNSLLLALDLHPQVSVGGRLDRTYEWDSPRGDAYSYGVILRPRNVQIGVQYQRFPDEGVSLRHPLDRRADQTTTAGIAVQRRDFTTTFQVMNLTRSDAPAFLEPHAGVEWRPAKDVALRAGGTQFSRSPRWAWTAGLGLLDANTFRSRSRRLAVPDDVFQCAVGVIYDHRVPEWAIASLTVAWNF